MVNDFKKKFLFNRDETGRFIVKSIKTGKSYFVEAIDGEERTSWDDVDPATKKMTGSYGDKYKGSIRKFEVNKCWIYGDVVECRHPRLRIWCQQWRESSSLSIPTDATL